MGLDIYVRWDDITEAERDAQITGFADAPEFGYLRFNWHGVSVMRDFAANNGLTNPIRETFQDWDGGNGEGYSVTRDKLDRLLAYQSRLEGWLIEHPVTERTEDEWKYYHRKIEGWVKFIDFIHGKIDKPGLAVVYG